jgi:hypothetical protein
VITGSDILAKGTEEGRPYGYVAIGKEIGDAVNGGERISVEKGFDMALLPVSDGVGGYAGGKIMSKPLGLKPSGKIPASKGVSLPIPGFKSGYKGTAAVGSTVDDALPKVKIGLEVESPKPLCKKLLQIEVKRRLIHLTSYLQPFWSRGCWTIERIR